MSISTAADAPGVVGTPSIGLWRRLRSSAFRFPLRTTSKVIPTTPTMATHPSLNPADARSLSGDSIPTEIYLQVISQLPKADLMASLRVSYFVHTVAAAMIYPSLYTSLDIDFQTPISPLFYRGTPIHPVPPGGSSMEVIETSVDRNGVRLDTCKRTSRDPLPNRFDSTTHLTLPSHDHSTCRLLPTKLNMPKLDTLRIRPFGAEDLLNLCNGPTSLSCPLIANLRPRKLIIGGFGTGLTGDGNGLWTTASSTLPSFVKELVVLVGMSARRAYGEASFLRRLPSTLEKVTFAISCGDQAYLELAQMGNAALLDELAESDDREVVAIRVMAAAVGGAQVIEIVGADAAERAFEDEETAEHVRSYMRLELRDGLVAQDWALADARKRADAVIFTHEEDYAEREEWYALQRAESKEALVVKIKAAAAEKRARLEASRRAAAEASAKMEAERAMRAAMEAGEEIRVSRAEEEAARAARDAADEVAGIDRCEECGYGLTDDNDKGYCPGCGKQYDYYDDYEDYPDESDEGWWGWW